MGTRTQTNSQIAKDRNRFIVGLARQGFSRQRALAAWKMLTEQPTATTHTVDDNALLDYEKAARVLLVSKGTLENWVSSGVYGVPFLKIGGRVRFRRSSLERWLQSRERSSDRQLVSAATASPEVTKCL